jgi:hypothetical protein
MTMITAEDAAWLEAVLDERIRLGPGDLPDPVREALAGAGLLDPAEGESALAEVRRHRVERPLEWTGQDVSQGDVLAAFASHCADDLDDVEVVETRPDLLVARWRTETSRLQLRAGFVGFERLLSEEPTMLIGSVGGAAPRVVEAFLDDPALRSGLAVCDLGRLERMGAPRSSVFVYLEWFLREHYSVKLLPASAFTQGLIERGIISLGMG